MRRNKILQTDLGRGLSAGDPVRVKVFGVWFLGTAQPTEQGRLNVGWFWVKLNDGRRLLRHHADLNKSWMIRAD
jgi:hypothetical protein